MKRLSRMVGVTLLEIMLVLAVASLVIVMSIRYYQSAQISVGIQNMQRAITSMIAYADSYGASAGTYTGLSVNGLWASLPKDAQSATTGSLKTPWGDAAIGLSGTPGDTSYGVTLTQANIPTSACEQVAAFVNAITVQRGGSATCKAGGIISWTANLNLK